jgi:hypothetical protein
MRKVLISLLLMSMLAFPAFSQQSTGGGGREAQAGQSQKAQAREAPAGREGSGEKIVRRLFIDISTSPTEHREKALAIREYLKIAIVERTEVVLVETEEKKDCTLHTSIEQDDDGAWIITATGYDEVFEKDAFEVRKTIGLFSLPAILEEVFPEITDRIRESFTPREQEVVEVVKEKVVEEIQVKEVKTGRVVFTLTGEPGTELVFSTGDTYTMDGAGIVETVWPYNTTVTFTAGHPDYFDIHRELLLKKEDRRVELEQKPYSRIALDVRLRMWEGALGLGAAYYLIPHYWFVSLYAESNFLSIRTITMPGRVIFISPVLSSGSYILPPESILRIAISGGVYTRIVFPRGLSPYFSKVTPVGLQLGLTGEISPWDKVRFFVEYTPRLFYSLLPQTGAQLINDGAMVGTVPMYEHVFLNFGLQLTLGVRILF